MITEREQQIMFANLVAEHGDPFAAALKMFPNDTSTALKVAITWGKNPEILALAEDGSGEDLTDIDNPDNKVKLAKKCLQALIDRIEYGNPNGKALSTNELVKVSKMIGDIVGFIKHAQPFNVGQVNNGTFRVVEYPAPIAPEKFEQESMRQQRELLDASRTRH